MKNEKLMFGAAYYPEYMPFDRMDRDFAMMKKAGINTIRIAESTWSTLEPEDGVFDFSYIDRILEKAQDEDMDVIVGTPTYAIPSWLAKKILRSWSQTHAARRNTGTARSSTCSIPPSASMRSV